MNFNEIVKALFKAIACCCSGIDCNFQTVLMLLVVLTKPIIDVILCLQISVHMNTERRITLNNQPNTFGLFLQAKRSGKMTLRAFATDIGVTPGYISDIENDRRDPPGKELLEKMAEVLGITGPDLVAFYDLAGQGRKEVSPDLPEYIMNSDVSDVVRTALRTAKNSGATVEDWQRFVEEMKRKGSEK